MKKLFFFLSFFILLASYFSTPDQVTVKTVNLSEVEPEKDEKEMSVEDRQKLQKLEELSQKGITDQDIEAIKKSFLPDGHVMTKIQLVNGSVEIDFSKVESEGQIIDDYYQQNDDEAQEYILSLNESDQMPIISSEEGEILDEVMSDFGYE